TSRKHESKIAPTSQRNHAATPTISRYSGQVLVRYSMISLVAASGLALAQGGPPGGRQVTVESIVVRPQQLSSSVRAVGTVLADASAVLRAEAPGQVLELHFKDGQKVAKGDRLFSIDSTVLEAEVNEARANVEQSEAAYNRATELIKNNLISATDYDTARANYNVAVARLMSSDTRLSKTVIRATLPTMTRSA
ncbi:MAG: biotin/lipoyl-binding protein, partial [Proteobacteria bacterium]|nr:biotin/lipoyl-binding protein [Pseudomonadota bacterium]